MAERLLRKTRIQIYLRGRLNFHLILSGAQVRILFASFDMLCFFAFLFYYLFDLFFIVVDFF